MNRLKIGHDIDAGDQNSDHDDDDDDDEMDIELFKTLSQLHQIIPNNRYSSESDATRSELSSSCSSAINQVPVLSLEQDVCRTEKEFSNEPSQVPHSPCRRIHSSLSSSLSSYVNDRREKVDEEQEKEKYTRKNHFHPNHNENDDDVVRNDKQKEKYQREEEKEEKAKKIPTTHFSFTSSLPTTTLFNADESQLIVVEPIDLSSTSSPHRHVLSNDSILFTNQLINDDLPQTTMNNNNQQLLDQTTSDLFDPFSPTSTTTMFDNLLEHATATDMKPTSKTNPFDSNVNQSLGHEDFDSLWNQSLGQLPSTSNNNDQTVDPNGFSWEAFLTDLPAPKETNDSTSNMTWESLFDLKKEEESDDLTQYLQWLFNHFDESPAMNFLPIQNLESIMHDIHMSIKPFEPIPSPPLHPNHSVPDVIHHDLFPIVESEPTNLIEPSMSKEQNQSESTFNDHDQVTLIVEQLVSTTLKKALEEVNDQSSDHRFDPINSFVEQILAEAVAQVYEEDSMPADEPKPIQIFDDVDLFSSHADRSSLGQERIDDDTSTLSEYLPPSIITNPNTPARLANNLMKYSLTAPVLDDSGDDSSMIEDYLAPAKVMNVRLFRFFSTENADQERDFAHAH